MTRNSLGTVFIGGLALAVLASCAANMMPSKDAWYAQHYFIMQDFERQAYKGLSEPARLEFQKLFWQVRDPDSKHEFDTRMAYIMKTYVRDNSKQPWNCDRARIYLLNGPPASIDYNQTDNWATSVVQGAAGSNNATSRDNEDITATTAEVWTYPYQSHFVQYAFSFRPPNDWRLDAAAFAGNRYIGELENMNKEYTYGIPNMDDYLKRLEELKKLKKTS